jgi:hypothetical protein
VAEAKEQCSNLDDQVSSAMMVIRGLERERDRLAEALRELWDNHTLHGAAYELIENTLAAVKGGQS